MELNIQACYEQTILKDAIDFKTDINCADRFCLDPGSPEAVAGKSTVRPS